jgi:drug/metabolite transporter (DMT)-like permease
VNIDLMGPLFCVLSAAGFGAMAIFGKLAYDAGVEVGALLLIRFAIASVVLLAIAYARGALRGLSRRGIAVGLAMGAIGYAAQSGLFFFALTRIDASLLALVLYVYPVLVMMGAIMIGRERASARRSWALGIALAGITLVLTSTATGRFNGLGALLGVGAALTYTGYILVGDRVTADIAPLALSTFVCLGATATFGLFALLTGGVHVGFAPVGWWWLVALALVSTVGAILLFFAGLAVVGPSVAAILSIVEPVVTVALAVAVFGEALTAGQLAGGLLVLTAVLITQWPSVAARPRPVAAPAGYRGSH